MEHPLSVVCVTYNALDVVAGLLDSLVDSGVASVVIVDNGSTDATVASLRARAEVTVVEQPNRGYAAGVNRGIAELPPDHDVLVLNPDLVLERGAVPVLRDALHAHPEVGIVVPSIVDGVGAAAPSLRREPRAWRTLVEAVVGGSRAGRAGEAFRVDPAQPFLPADWATGAAMVVRREVFDAVGLFDERFFLYSEETEFCLRARDAGWPTWCASAAVVRHAGGDMAHNPELWALRAVNRVRLVRQRDGRGAAVRMRLASMAFEARRMATGRRVSRAALRSLAQRDLEREAARLVAQLGGQVVQP